MNDMGGAWEMRWYPPWSYVAFTPRHSTRRDHGFHHARVAGSAVPTRQQELHAVRIRRL